MQPVQSLPLLQAYSHIATQLVLISLLFQVVVGARWAIGGIQRRMTANSQAVVELAAVEGVSLPCYDEARRDSVLTIVAYGVIGLLSCAALVAVTIGVVVCR